MTLLFAALLGNVLAWCVHALAWWLRARSFSVICVIGLIGAFWLIIISSIIFPRLEQRIFVFLVVLGISRIQSKHLTGIDDAQVLAAMLAFFGELLFAQLIANPLYFLATMQKRANDSGQLFLISFWVTLLTLALIRPQVVKVQKWLWQQLKPQRATNE